MKRKKKAPKIVSKEPTASVLVALSWYATGTHHGIARYARKAGWILDVSMTRSGQLPPHWEGDGIISYLGISPALDHFVEKASIPVVNIGHINRRRIPCVHSDDDAVGTMAAEYFLQRGFKSFAFYSRNHMPPENARRRAFFDRIKAAGHQYTDLDWYTAAQSYPKHDQTVFNLPWLVKQISLLRKPVAIFAEYDDPAVELLNACRSGNIPVPEQVAVLGVDNDLLRCEFAPIPLSSLDDDQELMGYEAAALLDRLMHGEAPPKSEVLISPRGVVTRKSTDILAIEHPLVASVLRTIRDHFTEPIGAKQIADTVPMSYRRLHDAFVRHVGHSISHEITLKRLELAQRLLIETKKKTIEIAWDAGFTDHDRMGKVFQRVLKMTPATYRRRFVQS